MNSVWKQWLYHLLDAGVSGAASSLVASMVDPRNFNFSHDGIRRVGELILAGFMVPIVKIIAQGLPKEPTA